MDDLPALQEQLAQLRAHVDALDEALASVESGTAEHDQIASTRTQLVDAMEALQDAIAALTTAAAPAAAESVPASAQDDSPPLRPAAAVAAPHAVTLPDDDGDEYRPDDDDVTMADDAIHTVGAAAAYGRAPVQSPSEVRGLGGVGAGAGDDDDTSFFDSVAAQLDVHGGGADGGGGGVDMSAILSSDATAAAASAPAAPDRVHWMELLQKRDVIRWKVMDVPQALQVQPADTEDQKKRKLKIAKQIRYMNKQKEAEKAREQERSSWQQFQTMATKRKRPAGFMTKLDKTSMFSTTEDGKVGVTGSGRPMTEFEEKKKFRLNFGSS